MTNPKVSILYFFHVVLGHEVLFTFICIALPLSRIKRAGVGVHLEEFFIHWHANGFVLGSYKVVRMVIVEFFIRREFFLQLRQFMFGVLQQRTAPFQVPGLSKDLNAEMVSFELTYQHVQCYHSCSYGRLYKGCRMRADGE